MDITMQEKLNQISDVFTPARPIETKDLFCGRRTEIDRIVGAINESGKQIVLYGERGVGKTSLANIINDYIIGVMSCKISCEVDDTFDSIWRRMLKRVTFVEKRSGIGFNAEIRETPGQLDLFLPQGKRADIDDLMGVLAHLKNKVIFIFDEYDRIGDKDVLNKMAGCFKSISDQSKNVTCMVVGISGTVDELIGHHQSLERCMKQVKMPRMEDSELYEIIDRGLRVLRMQIDEKARKQVVNFSVGYPHFTHLLMRFAATRCVNNSSANITLSYLDGAIEDAILDTQESVRNAYQKATLSTKSNNLFETVMFAVVLAKKDEHGTFGAADVAEQLFLLTGKHKEINAFSYHLGQFCQENRGAILEKVLIGKTSRYKIRNQMVSAYALLKLHRKNQARLV